MAAESTRASSRKTRGMDKALTVGSLEPRGTGASGGPDRKMALVMSKMSMTTWRKRVFGSAENLSNGCQANLKMRGRMGKA